ncbi:hypothetical protein [Paraburkholderia sp.]|uniref:hypothetical protein n=1 Tax=Paraburkholderia sp. TaxID=1926495 RepID=UPI003D6E0B4F
MKLFRVISVRSDCGAKPPRLAQETLATYTTRLQKVQRWHLHRATLTALDAIAKEAAENESSEREAAVTFVTAPEFYWSAPWHALRNVCEVRELSALQIDPVRRCVAKVAAQFPPERYGKLLFLPGTAAMLFETPRVDEADPIDPTHETHAASHRRHPVEPLFESLNYLYAVTNFLAPLAAHGPDADLPQAVAWPKRYTSWIDYGVHERELETPRTWTFRLGDGTRIEVLKQSDIGPQSHTQAHDNRVADMFDNRLGGVPPFGVDICLDFYKWMGDAHHAGGDFKAPHLDAPHYALDFVLSYGVDLDYHRFDVPRSLRYIVHNDGRRLKETAVLAIDERDGTWSWLPDAPATRHLTLGERSHVSIHEFRLDVPDEATSSPEALALHREPATDR